MFKHPYCGGQHETVAQARHCEAANTAEVAAGARAIREAQKQNSEDTWPWAESKTARPAKPAYPAKKPISDKKFKPLGVAYAEALAVRHGDAFEPSFVEPTLAEQGFAQVDIATEAQTGFILSLVTERIGEGSCFDFLTAEDAERAMDVMGQKDITKREATSLITALKALPKIKTASPKPQFEQPWRRLSREVPAGYYAITDANGKNHFYRVSVGRNDFYKVQEQASDELHFVSLNRYAGILQSILDFGLDNAGKLYATERSACRKCNRTLTDNVGNPYFEMGYGPECGK